MITEFKTFKQMVQYFSNEETCKAYLAEKRWGKTPCCPHCGNVGAYVTNRGFKCKAKECHKKFTVITGTIFENTKIKLSDWFVALYLVTAHKKGISSLQLHRDLGVTQKTAWFMLHRIREMLKEDNGQLTGTVEVEVDETYVGGSTKNMSNKKRKAIAESNMPMDNKTQVVAMVERGGIVKTILLPAIKPKFENILPVLQSNISQGATVVTDSSTLYGSLKNFYPHETVNHVQREYVRGHFHTNTVEGFFSQLKRGIIGIYHQVSPKHLGQYCIEFAYRYNTRLLTDAVRLDNAISLCNNKRLTYAKLTA